MAVLNSLKVVIENYPEGRTEEFDAPYNPNDPDAGTRKDHTPERPVFNRTVALRDTWGKIKK